MAYERWKFLYEAILQGQMNDSKSKCFSPTLPEADMRAEGLPRAIEVTRSGTSVLGGAVGSLDFCRSFATDIVEEIVEDYSGIMAKFDSALLGLPRRFVRRLQLPDHAAGLIGLPLAAGGLGYRTWRSTADCAYLAAYMHTPHHFP